MEPRLSRQRDLGSLHEPGLQQTPGCSRAADNLGSCQCIPPSRQPPHAGCATSLLAAKPCPPVPHTPFISGWREEGLAKITPQPGQGLGTALGGAGDVTAPGVSLWYPA